MPMIVHYGCFEDVSVVIDAVLFVVCHMPHIEALKLIVYLVVSQCYVIRGLLLIHCFSRKNSCYALATT